MPLVIASRSAAIYLVKIASARLAMTIVFMEINKPVSSILIFIITLLAVFFFVLPEYQASNDARQSLAKKQTEYSTKSLYYAQIAKADQDLQADQDSLAKMDSALPPQFLFAPLLHFFQQKGSDAGLTVTSVGFLPIVTEDSDTGFKTVTTTLALKGTYQDLKHFLASLDTSARLFEVINITFKGADATQAATKKPVTAGPESFNFQMEVTTHAY